MQTDALPINSPRPDADRRTSRGPAAADRATPRQRRKPPARIPLRWHTRPDGSERALFPDLKPWQVRLLFDKTEADREAHPRKKRTVIRYGGHRFVVDGTILGLRLWYRKVLVSRRWGLGL